MKIDFYKYIENPDIRKHMQEIGYEPRGEEIAWYIWRSHLPIKEKHQSWNELIENYGNEMITKSTDEKYNKLSLKRVLYEYMKIETMLIESIKEKTGNVYTYFNIENILDRFLDDFESCVSIAIKNNGEYFTAYNINGIVQYIKFNINGKGELFEVKIEEPFSDEEQVFDLYNHFFQRMQFEIPVPFKVGDYIMVANVYLDGNEYRYTKSRPFLITRIVKGTTQETTTFTIMSIDVGNVSLVREERIKLNREILRMRYFWRSDEYAKVFHRLKQAEIITGGIGNRIRELGQFVEGIIDDLYSAMKSSTSF